MTTATITIRDADGAVYSQVHPSRIDYLVAALSDDPESIPELRAALRRFLAPDGAARFFDDWPEGIGVEPGDAGLFVIDLPGRLLVVPSSDSAPWDRAGVPVADAAGKEVVVPYRLADEWLIVPTADGWEALADERRRARTATPPFDARPTLFGSVCEFIARECAAAAGCPPSAEGDVRQAISDIHARWLMTPRDDLRGKAPRDVLLEQHSHIGWQLQDRSEYWSLLDRPAPPLPRASTAYRFAGFGTHEIVLYYELVRFLISACWDQLLPTGPASEAAITAETRRLEGLRDQWLNSTDVMDLHGRTPASVMEAERRRMPEGMSGADAMVDHDCPMCEMMAEMPGPFFWHLDGCNMDEGFAFSFHPTREEWEAEQREFEEMDRRIRERMNDRERLPDSPWQTSYGADPESMPPALAMYSFAAHLAELTENLRAPEADPARIDSLNRAFGDLREVCTPLNLDLFEPVVERLCEELGAVAAARPELFAKTSDFERRLRAFQQRMTNPPVGEDLPF